MFSNKNDEIIQHLHNTEMSIMELKLAVGILNQILGDMYKQNAALQEQVRYLADAEEARATHNKKPARKAKVEEMNGNG